jgi:hypothetical protein
LRKKRRRWRASALDYVQDGDVELRGTEAALAEAEADHATSGEVLAELHDRYKP